MTPSENEPNPYAVPQSALEGRIETEHDRFILEQVTSMLRPRERVRYTAFLVQAPSPAMLIVVCMAIGAVFGVAGFALREALGGALPMALVGGLVGGLGGLTYALSSKPYLAAVTTRRLVLFRTRVLGFRPQRVNLGVEQIRWKHVERVEVGGVANNRSLRFVLSDGTERTLRIAPWARFVSGQKAFFEFTQSYDPAALRAQPAAAAGAADEGDTAA